MQWFVVAIGYFTKVQVKKKKRTIYYFGIHTDKGFGGGIPPIDPCDLCQKKSKLCSTTHVSWTKASLAALSFQTPIQSAKDGKKNVVFSEKMDLSTQKKKRER